MNKLITTSILIISLFACLIHLGQKPASTIQPPPSLNTCYKIDTSQVFALTNNERRKAGLAPLSENTLLDRAAALKAQDMVASHYWAHTSPAGVEPWHWFNVVGYNYQYAGENLAQNSKAPQTLMASWMTSPGHRANVLSPNYTQIGIATICGTTDRETTLTVAEYGSPK